MSIKCGRSSWGQAGALLGALDVCGETGSKGWKGMGQFPKDQDLVASFVPDQVAKPGHTTFWRLKVGRDTPVCCFVG